jgi:5-methylcytosine-specific restriction endonuclease McrA
MANQFLLTTGEQYDSMRSRFKPKYKDDGSLKKPGREIPFTKAEYRDWVNRLMDDPRGLRCIYCDAVLSIERMEPDHLTPVKRGGSLGLANLGPACKLDNQRKGELDKAEYTALLRGLKTFPQYARNYILKCLATAAMGARMRFHPREKAAVQPKPAAGECAARDAGK